ncbi:MAG: hypothetical protein RIS36_1946 [Pseudomonadota bacterium]
MPILEGTLSHYLDAKVLPVNLLAQLKRVERSEVFLDLLFLFFLDVVRLQYPF